MTQNERQLKAIEAELARHAEEIETVLGKAETEERETSSEEREAMEKSLKAPKELKAKREDVLESIKTEEDVKEVARKFGKAEPTSRDRRTRRPGRRPPGPDHQVAWRDVHRVVCLQGGD
jgi:hypothetical protein